MWMRIVRIRSGWPPGGSLRFQRTRQPPARTFAMNAPLRLRGMKCLWRTPVIAPAELPGFPAMPSSSPARQSATVPLTFRVRPCW